MGFACLTYHCVRETGNVYGMPAEQFRAQLRFLKDYGWKAECVRQLEARLQGRLPIPSHYVVLTFDDGDISVIRAAEMLAEFGFRASVFVTRDKSMHGWPFLSPAEIRTLRSLGFSMGTHGTSHRRLSALPERECLAELRESKKWLEDILGEPVRYMSAPHGALSRRVLGHARQQGYVLVATSREALNCADKIALPGTLARVAVRRHYSLGCFRHILEGRSPFYLWRRAQNAARGVKVLLQQRLAG